MKKQDLIMVGILVALMLAWPWVYNKFFPARPGPAPALATNAPAGVVSTALPTSAPVTTAPTPSAVVAPTTPPVTPPAEPARPLKPEQRETLTNADLTVTVSSWGAACVAAELKQYRQTLDPASGPVVLDFSASPALAYTDLAGLSRGDDFEITRRPADGALRAEKNTADGLRLIRTITLGAQYQLSIQDILTNAGTTSLTLPGYGIQIGPMRMAASETRTMGLDYMGIDALPASGGEGVTYWAGKLVDLFKQETKARNLAVLPVSVTRTNNVPIDWLAAKSKFFVQILAPEGGAAGYLLSAGRKVVPGEIENPALSPKKAEIAQVAATALLAGKTLAPGEALTQTYRYYVGPKKFSLLKELGFHQEDVMDFGWWAPLCKILLIVLNWTYTVIPSYGVAIILLTILIQILFWPLTQKSTASMRKMQELQPLMTELRAKHKDNPRKLQEETMALYRKNKVNPMSGCLPMLIQIPVFFALFVVLRSAVELRFAPFLWIPDLSEPERLLAGVLPIPLNILPILNAATMAWQQKITPTTGDLSQQKMMMYFMPVMMLVLFYNMPSALVLYWTTSQIIAIGRQLLTQRKKAPKN